MRHLLLISLLFPFEAFSALNLKESFEAALKNNQVDNINRARIEQVTEQKTQNMGAYYPKLALKGTYQKLDSLEDQKAYGLNLTQTLYRGGRDREAVLASEQAQVVSKNQWTLDRLALYQSVIQSYYNYFLSLNDFSNLELLKKQSLERVNEIKNRVRIGRSRGGELLQAEAQLASVDAQLLSGEALKKESEDKFYLLVGVDKGINIEQLIVVEEEKRTLSDFLNLAYKRPDLINKEIKITQTDFDLSIAKRAQLPTLDLASNYYFNKRTGTYRNSSWDAGLVLTLPLFEGGASTAKVKENVQKKEEAIYSLRDYKKSIEIELTSKYQTYRRYADQIKAFDLALAKAQKNYEESLKDYRLGLISNLDVLSALNLYLDSKRNSEKTKIQAMMNLKILEATAGVIQ